MYRLFHDLDHGMQPISVLFPYLPIEAHRKRDASRQERGWIHTQAARIEGPYTDDMFRIWRK